MSSFYERFEPLTLPIHGVRLPNFEIPPDVRQRHSIPPEADNLEVLKILARNGFRKLKFKDEDEKKKYGDRVKYELDIVAELGFVDYFLLVWYVIDFCISNSIPTGYARGSAGGSLILNLIGVTKIDPIRHGLFFERFISKTRAKKKVVDGVTYLDGKLMCDVDLDICYYRRGEVLKFLEEKFKGRTAQISNIVTLSGKLLLKEVCKVVGEMTEDEAQQVSNMIPKVHGKVRDIYETYEGKKNKQGEEVEPPVQQFKEWADENREYYEIGLKLRDLIKNKGVHASGVLLSYDPIDQACPLELTQEGGLVSAFDMDWVSLFNIKLDILGNRSASIVDDVCKQVGVKMEEIPLDDPSIYRNLYELKAPHGIFQIEADTNYRVCQTVRPKNLEELSAILALARPGAMAFVDQYAKYTNHGVYEPIHPFFDEIFRPTGGISAYQEQLIQMVKKIGFSAEEGESVRRVISKKDVKEMPVWEEKVKNKIKEQNLPEEVGKILWSIMDASKDYSFNKCLSKLTLVETPYGMRFIQDVQAGDSVRAFSTSGGKDLIVRILAKHESKVILFRVGLKGGNTIDCSLDHRFLCQNGKMERMADIISNNLLIRGLEGLYYGIQSVKEIGLQETLDLEVDSLDHNFYANGLVTSNSHSAAYAMLSAATVYLKFNHPKEFFLSLLRMSKFETKPIDEIRKIQREMVQHFDIPLFPPHIVHSKEDFSIEGKGIRFGLSSIKGIADKSMEKVTSFRVPFADKFQIFQTAKQVGMPIGILSALIQAGALEGFQKSRCFLVLEAQLWNLLTDKERALCIEHGKNFDYNLNTTVLHLIRNVVDSKGKAVIKPSRHETIKKKYDRYKQIYALNVKNEIFANWYYERTLLGFSYSTTLKEIFSKVYSDLQDSAEVRDSQKYERVCGMGVVIKTREWTSKKKAKCLRFDVEDECGELKLLAFNEGIKEIEARVKVLPKENDIVFYRGKWSGSDGVFLDQIRTETQRIYLGLRDLKEKAS